MPENAILQKIQDQLEEVESSNSKDDATRKKLLETVWQIGQEAYQYGCETGATINLIAQEVDAPPGSLQKMVRFYRLFPDGAQESISGKPLNWSHYCAVLYLREAEIRNFYLNEAATQEWSSHELRLRIRNNYFESRQMPADISATRKNTLKPSPNRLYTYTAEVVRVVDGDTLLLNIDVGFKTLMEYKVRLRGINCPELGTKIGEEAKQFVEETLNQCGRQTNSDGQKSKPLVAIQTFKAEKFGRYLVDVYYLPTENDRERIVQEGYWLNQTLLNKGLARVAEY